jgi:hypothetical protein
VFAGVGDRGAFVTLLSYASAGVGVELVVAFSRKPLGTIACVIAGLGGNLMKLGTKTLLEILVGVPAGFVALGRIYPLMTYILFGALGGYLGFLVVSALRRAGYFAYLAQRH